MSSSTSDPPGEFSSLCFLLDDYLDCPWLRLGAWGGRLAWRFGLWGRSWRRVDPSLLQAARDRSGLGDPRVWGETRKSDNQIIYLAKPISVLCNFSLLRTNTTLQLAKWVQHWFFSAHIVFVLCEQSLPVLLCVPVSPFCASWPTGPEPRPGLKEAVGRPEVVSGFRLKALLICRPFSSACPSAAWMEGEQIV